MKDRLDGLSQPLVLVVNDDEAMRHALCFLLRLEGMEIELHEAAKPLLASRDLPRANCLIVKEALPEMSGLDILRALARRHIHIPAILLAVRVNDTLRQRAAELGCRLVLESPVMDSALVDGVWAIVNGEI